MGLHFPKTPIFYKNYKLLFIVIIMLLALVTLHVPFLESDPDLFISDSRGANTDEGLYTCQLRNYTNHSTLTLNKTDGLAKTPLFSALLYLPFKMWGTQMLVARLVVLLLSIVLCFIAFTFNTKLKTIGIIAICIVFTQFSIFHFFHYSLSEAIVLSLIMLGIFGFLHYLINKKIVWGSFIASLCISLAYYVKIQYVYCIVILPASVFLFFIFIKNNKKIYIKALISLALFLSLFFSIYIIAWYLPNKALINYVLFSQTSGKFVALINLPSHFLFLLKNIFFGKQMCIFSLVFLITFPLGLVLWFKSKSPFYRMLFMALSVWLIMESHKLLITYFPTRYLLGLFLAMGLLIALVLQQLFFENPFKKRRKIILIFTIILFTSMVIQNAFQYTQSFNRRTYVIKQTNAYLAQFNFVNYTIIGAWAPSLCWSSKAITLPVWKGYFNDTNSIAQLQPALIISEPNEEDSDRAFDNQGINLYSISDSVISIKVNKWPLNLYWVKQSISHKGEIKRSNP